MRGGSSLRLVRETLGVPQEACPKKKQKQKRLLNLIFFLSVYRAFVTNKPPKKTVGLFLVFVPAFCLRRFGTAGVRSQRNKRMLFLEPREGRVSTAGHQLRSGRSANVPSALTANRSKKTKTTRSLDFIKDESMDKRVDQAVGDKLLRRPTR